MGKRFATARRVLAGMLLTAVFFGSLGGAVVILKNGKRFEGTILQETDQEIVLQLKFGTLGLRKEQILEIRRGDASPAAAPAISQAGGHEGGSTIAVRKEYPGYQRDYLLEIQDAVAIWYADHPDRMLTVSFLPFRLTPAEKAEIAAASGDQVFAVLRRRPSPDPQQWDSCPYAYVNIHFAAGLPPGPKSVTATHLVLFGLVYANESMVFDEKAAAHGQVERLELSVQGTQGELELLFSGENSGIREISSPAQTHAYRWKIDVRSPVFIK